MAEQRKARTFKSLRRPPEGQASYGAVPADVVKALQLFGSSPGGERVLAWLDGLVYRTCPTGLENGAWRDFEAERRFAARIAVLMQGPPSNGDAGQTRKTTR